MTKFTYAERVRMLMAAFEMCPECQAEFKRFAEVPGRDAIEFMRDLLWNLWQNWPHGAGCPRALPEVPARIAPDAVGSSQGASAAEAAAQQPGIVLKDPEASTL